MPLKAILNGTPVLARNVAGTGAFTCAECSAAMHYVRTHLNGDVVVQMHFAHNPTPSGSEPRTCSSVGQSEEHMNAKECIRLAAPGHFWWLTGLVGDVEVPLGDRRADVLFTLPGGQRVVFEPQFTKIPRSQIAERTRDYHALGVHVIWCFPERRADLYDWAKEHFFCVGLLSDDGNEVTFSGDLNPSKHAPGLRAKFDDETDPDAWKRGANLSGIVNDQGMAAPTARNLEEAPRWSLADEEAERFRAERAAVALAHINAARDAEQTKRALFPPRPLRDDKPENIVTTVDDGAWAYTKDRFGDWRGTSGNRRTRLKGTLDWARKDAAAGRVQRRLSIGEWIDDIAW